MGCWVGVVGVVGTSLMVEVDPPSRAVMLDEVDDVEDADGERP